MKTTKVKVGGREFALAFTLDAMATLADMIEGFDVSQVSDYAKTPGGMTALLYALAEQGELLEGRKLDVDRAWFGSHISPAPLRVAKLQISVLSALAAGFSMETEEEETGEVDVALEEIKKKDGQDS